MSDPLDPVPLDDAMAEPQGAVDAAASPSETVMPARPTGGAAPSLRSGRSIAGNVLRTAVGQREQQADHDRVGEQR